MAPAAPSPAGPQCLCQPPARGTHLTGRASPGPPPTPATGGALAAPAGRLGEVNKETGSFLLGKAGEPAAGLG